jgi:hypothetical protein
MSSTRFRRIRSSREPGMVDPCVAASEGRGAGGGIGRRRLGSGSAGAGLITSFHCSWRARGLGTTWLRSTPATPRWSDAGFRSTRTTFVVVSLRFFRKWLGRRPAFLGSSGLSSGCGTGLCLSTAPTGFFLEYTAQLFSVIEELDFSRLCLQFDACSGPTQQS